MVSRLPDGGQAGDSRSHQAARIDTCFEPLVAVTRGSIVESVHRGAIAVVDANGELVGGVGDPRLTVILRSAAKPFQALAVIESGAAEALSVTDRELAVMCASHAGAVEHLEVVTGLLERLGVSPPTLLCGSLEHNCSGKHAGMAAIALHMGVSLEGYERVQHPVQSQIAGTIRSLLGRRPRRPDRLPEPAAVGRTSGSIFAGIDGCGVPALCMSLSEAAWLYAALAAGITPGLARVRNAMLAHPGLVAGDGRLDTRVMRAAGGRVIAKGGAEGVQGLALLSGFSPDPSEEIALGCVMKVEDGSSRPLTALVAFCLRRYGLEEVAAVLEQKQRATAGAAVTRASDRTYVLLETADLGGGRGRERMPSREGEQSGFGGERPELKHLKLTIGRGDEKEVRRFLRDEWPAADEETFGRPVEWIAESIAFILRRRRRIAGVLKGHFVGGVGSVNELIVGRGQRGAGVGSLLLEQFEEEAERRGCRLVVLRAVKGSKAEEFYRSRGYHRECVEHSYEYGYDYVRLTRGLPAARDGTGGGASAD